jgi:hypothetical protein
MVSGQVTDLFNKLRKNGTKMTDLTKEQIDNAYILMYVYTSTINRNTILSHGEQCNAKNTDNRSKKQIHETS